MLEVQSDDKNYNAAAEEIWRQWFAAPTFRPNVSGASWLKLCVRNLPKCGEFLSVIATDPYAEGPVQLRLRPLHPRRLASPMHVGQSDRHIMGIEFDQFDRPARYWITESESLRTKHVPYSPDDIIHEFVIDEEGQARGYPWIAPSLPSIADLRDFDDQILDASRQMADQCQLLYTEHPDAPFYAMPESTTIERRTCKMAPPGWKPATYQAALPPVQYPDFRAEKHRDIGRPFNMPLMMVRLDASNHNYSSARIDTQSYNRTCEGIQCWLSGTPESCGMLNRLADLVFREARFSVAALKRRPAKVIYVWTWPQRPHVDPSKEADAETASLETGTLDFITALQNRGTTLDRHLKSLVRAVEAFKAAGLPLPAWAAGVAQAATPDARAARRTNEKLEAVNAS
jgi:capsid protein